MSKRKGLLVFVAGLAALTASLWFGVGSVRAAGSDHVRWDIINVDIPITTLSAGGVAFATAPNNLRIRLTGSGTFVAPANGGISGAVTGGGTWETFNVKAKGLLNPNLGTRAMALLNVGIQDAMVAAWDTKFAYNRPRPHELDPTLPKLLR